MIIHLVHSASHALVQPLPERPFAPDFISTQSTKVQNIFFTMLYQQISSLLPRLSSIYPKATKSQLCSHFATWTAFNSLTFLFYGCGAGWDFTMGLATRMTLRYAQSAYSNIRVFWGCCWVFKAIAVGGWHPHGFLGFATIKWMAFVLSCTYLCALAHLALQSTIELPF